MVHLVIQLTYQISVERSISKPFHDQREEDRESLSWDTSANVEEEDEPQLPIFERLN